MTDLKVTSASRLSPQPREVIDRAQAFTFTFDGEKFQAHPGDTIASALAAAGVRVFSRSFKYHGPRGLMCGAGNCPNCLVQVGDEPNVRSCKMAVESDMEVFSQNAWPSLKQDAMSLTSLVDRFTPVGFYYKTFMRPQAMWPTYEKALRHAAGLGKLNIDMSAPDDFQKQYLHGDIIVVGGGPAGMSAAISAAVRGARVVLIDENSNLGGHTRYSTDREAVSVSDNLRSQIVNLTNISVITDCTVQGYWEDHWLSAVSGRCFYKIRGKSVVFATGVYEQPLVFGNNDLPGVMLGSGVARMLHLYGVAMGQTVVVFTANDNGWRVAWELQTAGLNVATVIDERPQVESDLSSEVIDKGAAVHWAHTVLEAQGRGHVKQVVIAPTNPNDQVNTLSSNPIPCDLLAVCAGWTPANGLLYQAGAKIGFNQRSDKFLPEELPSGIFAAGRVVGWHDLETEITSGQRSGLLAADHVAGKVAESIEEGSSLPVVLPSVAKASQLPRASGKQKRFVCFCEDVTDKDLRTAIAEGYDSVELLKRYSTISMGPCQGKMCSVNAIHLCAQANDTSVAETGTTVSRPPSTPVIMAALAGQYMEPVRYTPVHDWHVDNGAKMMVAGLWMRAEHYGDPTAEVNAVRQGVGLIDVSTLGKLQLTGLGVPDLLERIYLNQWRRLGIGRVRYGVMCNDEGIVLDDGVTARLADNAWYMTTTSSGATGIYEWIQWWAQSGWGKDVHITNVADSWAAFNLAGPLSRQVLQSLTSDDLSSKAFPYMHMREIDVAGVSCRVLRIGFTGELSFEIHCPSGYGRFLWETIMDAGKEFGIRPFGVEAQRILRLEKGHVIIGQDTDALSNPISVDLGWVVKLEKVNFLGKRAVTRLSHEGTKQKLVGFKTIDSSVIPEEGLQIVRADSSGAIGLEILGWVTSSRYSPTLGESIGLCWLPTELAERPGTQFSIRRDGKLVEATVHHGPFYDPKGSRLRA